jgi:hypothetical protein
MPIDILPNTPQPDLPANQSQEINPPPPPPQPNSKRKRVIMWAIFSIFVLLYIGLNVSIYLYGMKGLTMKLTKLSFVKEQGLVFRPTSTPTPIPTPTPTPIQLPPGKGTYTVSQSTPTGPRISKVSFDPLDVHKGETLTVTIATRDTVPVQSIKAVLTTDNGGQKTLQFTRIDGTDLAGDWQATVPMDDTVWYTYTLQIMASSSSGLNSFAVTPR